MLFILLPLLVKRLTTKVFTYSSYQLPSLPRSSVQSALPNWALPELLMSEVLLSMAFNIEVYIPLALNTPSASDSLH